MVCLVYTAAFLPHLPGNTADFGESGQISEKAAIIGISSTSPTGKETATDTISNQIARQVMLAAQGLDCFPVRPAVLTAAGTPAAGKADVLGAVRRMGALQIDTIHVVARSPYLVLWSRLGDYRPEWLDELLAEKALFEYWSHAMCFLPIDDYPLYRRRMLDAPQSEAAWVRWAAGHPEVMDRVRARLQENGTVRSVEFETKNRPPGGWWNWKDEKTALEFMLLMGEVMISRRHNFQRVYALHDRVLPDWDDAATPAAEEVRRQLALRAVESLGIALASWVPDYFRLPKKGMLQRLNSSVEQGLLAQVKVEGFEEPAYIHPSRLDLLEEAASGRREPVLTTLLSPFDPLVWDRQRARDLFGFDYTIECYTPAAKRLYGYFTLPILHRGRLVGRLDPKAHRAQGVFEVKAVHLEPGLPAGTELASDLAAALHRLASWHAARDIVVRGSNPPEFAALLESAL